MTDPKLTPPPELMQQWLLEAHPKEAPPGTCPSISILITRAAQWGADQELEAIQKEIITQSWFVNPSYRLTQLRTARRPKLLTLKEQALQALNDAVKMADDVPPEGICSDQVDIIRRAIEALPE
jgi:hypothetical protein